MKAAGDMDNLNKEYFYSHSEDDCKFIELNFLVSCNFQYNNNHHQYYYLMQSCNNISSLEKKCTVESLQD